MNEQKTPAEYIRDFVHPLIDSICFNLDSSDFGIGMVDMTATDAGAIKCESDSYEKWLNDWNTTTTKLHSLTLEVRGLCSRLVDVEQDLERHCAEWIIDPMATQAAS